MVMALRQYQFLSVQIEGTTPMAVAQARDVLAGMIPDLTCASATAIAKLEGVEVEDVVYCYREMQRLEKGKDELVVWMDSQTQLPLAIENRNSVWLFPRRVRDQDFLPGWIALVLILMLAIIDYQSSLIPIVLLLAILVGQMIKYRLLPKRTRVLGCTRHLPSTSDKN